MKALAAAACILVSSLAQAAEAYDPGITDAEVVFGMINAQSGPKADLSRHYSQGISAAIKQANQRGGVHGRKITLLAADDRGQPGAAEGATLQMINNNRVLGFTGFVGPTSANASVLLVREHGIPVVGLLSGTASLRTPVAAEIFNTRAGYQDELRAMVDAYASHTSVKRFAVLAQDDAFGRQMFDDIDAAVRARGLAPPLKVRAIRDYVKLDEPFQTVKAADPDVVIMLGSAAPLAAFAHLAHAAGLRARLATPSFVGVDELAKALDPADGPVTVSQVVPFPGDTSLPVVKNCKGQVEQDNPGEPFTSASLEGCIAGETVVAGLQRAGRKLSRAGFIAALDATKKLDLGGFTIGFAADNHQGSDAVYFVRLNAGKLSPLKKTGLD